MAGCADDLAADRPAICVDLVGHGRSDAPDDDFHYSMLRCCEQLRALLDRLGIERPHLLGYSMGGRVALSFCVRYPEVARSALVIGASPGLSDHEQRAERIAADEALAERIVEEGLEAFVDHWTALPLFASQARLDPELLAAAREQRLRNRPHGLAASLRGMGTGAMAPIPMPEIKIPVCFVAGAEDAKFRRIARELATRVGDARVELVPEAGHAAQLEQPEPFARIARDFFTEVDAGSMLNVR